MDPRLKKKKEKLKEYRNHGSYKTMIIERKGKKYMYVFGINGITVIKV